MKPQEGSQLWTDQFDRLFFRENAAAPDCDIEEGESYFLLTLDLPGLSRDKIKIEHVDDLITVTGERRQDRNATERHSWRSERRFGTFTRVFRVPQGTDPAAVEASYEDGVLRIYVPKPVSSRPRQIKVSTVPHESPGFLARLLGGQARSEASGTKEVHVA